MVHWSNQMVKPQTQNDRDKSEKLFYPYMKVSPKFDDIQNVNPILKIP